MKYSLLFGKTLNEVSFRNLTVTIYIRKVQRKLLSSETYVSTFLGAFEPILEILVSLFDITVLTDKVPVHVAALFRWTS